MSVSEGTEPGPGYVAYTTPSGKIMKLYLPVPPDEDGRVVDFFCSALTHGGAYTLVFEAEEDTEDEEDSMLSVHVEVYNQTDDERYKAYFSLNDDGNFTVYRVAEADHEKSIQDSHISAARAFSLEMSALFDDPDYFENAEMASWGVVREVFHFTVAGYDDAGVEQPSLNTWYKLSFPDGSTLFHLPGDKPSLRLPKHLEPQYQAALAKKAAAQGVQGKPADPRLLTQLADFLPTGPCN
jgi:hypothetical protein